MNSVFFSRTGIDMIPLLVTYLCCLFLGLEYGMLIGVLVNVLFILYSTARPKIDISVRIVYSKYVLVVVPDQSLVFSAAEHTKDKILKHVDRNAEHVDVIVIDGNFVHSIDVTVAKVYNYRKQILIYRSVKQYVLLTICITRKSSWN